MIEMMMATVQPEVMTKFRCYQVRMMQRNGASHHTWKAAFPIMLIAITIITHLRHVLFSQMIVDVVLDIIKLNVNTVHVIFVIICVVTPVVICELLFLSLKISPTVQASWPWSKLMATSSASMDPVGFIEYDPLNMVPCERALEQSMR